MENTNKINSFVITKFMGMDVVGGDDGDARFMEPQGVVCALYAKGKAVHDDSGFVVG